MQFLFLRQHGQKIGASVTTKPVCCCATSSTTCAAWNPLDYTPPPRKLYVLLFCCFFPRRTRWLIGFFFLFWYARKCKWWAVCHVSGSNELDPNVTWTHQTNGSLCGMRLSTQLPVLFVVSDSEGEFRSATQWLHADAQRDRGRISRRRRIHLSSLQAGRSTNRCRCHGTNLAEKSEKGLAVVRLHHRHELLSFCSSSAN